MSNEDVESVPSSFTRRSLLHQGGSWATAGIVTMATCTSGANVAEAKEAKAPAIRMGDVVLFQGDSITDAGRRREAANDANSSAAMGDGYAWLAASSLLLDRPNDELRFFNQGISGNKVPQLDERWDADCLALKPNVLSILIGVNDFWHKQKGAFGGTFADYEAGLRNLLLRTNAAIPEVRLVICEPFLLRAGEVQESWIADFAHYREAARKVAAEMGAVFVDFQNMFDAAVRFASPEVWAEDGVHPTPAGSALMARWWLKSVGEC